MAARLSDIASFIAVVDHGSISAAARASGVPKSTLSRHITRLEAELGVALLTRASQRISITAAGRQLHARASGALAALQDVELQLREGQQEPHGILVVTAPHNVALSAAFIDLLLAYRARCPRVRLEVRLETRYVDLVREGVDVAIRGHGDRVPGDPELLSRAVSTMPIAFFTSAAYLRAHGTPADLADLAAHTLLVHGAAHHPSIPLSSEHRTVQFTPETPAVLSNEFRLLRALAARGAGIALLPVPLAEGSALPPLIRVLPAWHAQQGRLSVVWPRGRFVPAKQRIFIDMAIEMLGDAA